MRQFWNWAQNEAKVPELRIDGEIWSDGWAAELFEGTAAGLFREELNAQSDGDIVLWINSAGGDVFAAASIYTMLKEYAGRVTVKIDGLCASAASVIAMAGDEILMSPPSMMMIHEPWTMAMGNAAEMERTKPTLLEVRDAIASAYELRTGKPREEVCELMANETWMSAAKAVELGFANGMLYGDEQSGMRPAACILTAQGMYAYAGRRAQAEMAEREAILRECQALWNKVKADQRKDG